VGYGESPRLLGSGVRFLAVRVRGQDPSRVGGVLGGVAFCFFVGRIRAGVHKGWRGVLSYAPATAATATVVLWRYYNTLANFVR
jgi:hypothetical protein